MIYSIKDNAEMGPGGVFNDNFTDDLLDPYAWKNFMPDLASFGEIVFFDEHVLEFFNLVGQSDYHEKIVEHGLQSVESEALGPGGYLAQLGARNVVSALRAVVGNVAITVGILRRSRTSLKHTFNDPFVTVANSVDMLSQIVNSEYFQKAVQAISYWPIVGWIIAIVADVLKTVVRITDFVAMRRLKKVTRELARRFYLPLYAFDQVGDEHETLYMRALLWNIQTGGADRLFRPAYGATDAAQLEAWPATDPEEEYKGHQLPDAWYIYLKGRSGSDPKRGGGLGFLPGTGRLVLMDEIRSPACGEGTIRNVGDYFVTVRSTASYVWNVALQEGNPFTCAIDTRGMQDAWADHVYAAMVFAAESVSNGWSCVPVPWPDGPISIDTPSQDQAVCHPSMWGAYPGRSHKEGVCSEKGAKPLYGSKMPIPAGISHFEEYVNHLVRLYWGRGPEQDQFPLPVRDLSKTWDPDTYYFQNMSSSLAIGNMRDRQSAFLDGPDAFYVHPFDAQPSTGQPPVAPFGALSDPTLRERWEQNLTDFLQAPQIWQTVLLPDVPKMVVIDGDEKLNPIYKILKDRGLPETVPHKFAGAGGRIGVDPGYNVKPPDPPEQAGNSIRLVAATLVPQAPLPPVPGWSTRKKVLVGAAAAGALVGVGALAYRRWGRGFVDLGTLVRP